MPLSAAAVKLAREAHAAAPRGGRTAAVCAVARQFNVSPAALYRALGLGGPARRRPAVKPEYREWVRTAVQLANASPKGPAPLDTAIEAAVKGGDLPPEAADMPVGTAHRIARELGISHGRRRRAPRVAADWPMQAVLVDGSTSEHLVVDRRADPADPDPPLRLHRNPMPASGYKNKPLPPDRRRVMVYGLWDMCTGTVRSRYVAARGECALDALEFLCWALDRPTDSRIVMHGVPDDIWSDQGPLAHSKAAADLIKRLTTDPSRADDDDKPRGLVLGAPYTKSRMGGIERANRTRWRRFERALFLAREGLDLTISTLNERLAEFEIRENNRRLSRTPVDGRPLSRTLAWAALMRRRPWPLRALPEAPMETLAAEARRRVDVGGIVRWGGRLYESPWHDRTVIARRALDGGGDITLEDEATGEYCIAQLYTPRAYGDVRVGAATPVERLMAEPAAAALRGADVWAPKAGAPAVVPMPAPAAAARPLRNPLPAGLARCRDMGEAWRVFMAVYPWPLTPGQRERIEARFRDLDMVRSAVVGLAQELVAAAGQAGKVSHG